MYYNAVVCIITDYFYSYAGQVSVVSEKSLNIIRQLISKLCACVRAYRSDLIETVRRFRLVRRQAKYFPR